MKYWSSQFTALLLVLCLFLAFVNAEGLEEHSAEEEEEHSAEEEAKHQIAIIYGSVPTLAIGTIPMIISMGMFWKRRDMFPLKGRIPALVMMTTGLQLGWFLTTAISVILTEYVSCTAKYFILMFFNAVCGNMIMTRLFTLAFRIEIANQQATFTKKKAESSTADTVALTKLNMTDYFFLRYRWIIETRSLVILNLIMDGIFLVAIVLKMTLEPPPLMRHIICAPEYIASFWISYAGIMVLWFVITAYRTRNFGDGFHLRSELMFVSLATIFPLVLLPVMVYIPSAYEWAFRTVEIPFIDIFVQYYCIISVLAQTAYPLFLSYRSHNSMTDSQGATSASHHNQSINNEMSKSITSDVPNNKVLFAPKVGKERKLLALLASLEGQQAFMQFLYKEFSQENLKFYLEVVNFEKIFAESNETKQKAEAWRIYNQYIKPGAPLQLNIPGMEAADIEAEVTKNGAVQASVFQAAKEHTFLLMSKDSLQRFLKSSLADQFRVAEA